MITVMESDMDHKSVALQMMLWYRDDAGPYALLQRGWSLQQGDLPKFEDWKQVVNVIVEMRGKLPPEYDGTA